MSFLERIFSPVAEELNKLEDSRQISRDRRRLMQVSFAAAGTAMILSVALFAVSIAFAYCGDFVTATTLLNWSGDAIGVAMISIGAGVGLLVTS